VVVPSLNQGRLLRSCLRSIVNQDFPPHEIVVIDGGSTDESLEVIGDYKAHLHYWCSEPDGGQAAGIAKGFRHCTGEILCWLNSDDQFTPGALNTVAKSFQRDGHCDVVYGDMLWLSATGEVQGTKREIGLYREMLLWDHNYIPQPSTFWKRDLYFNVGGIRSDFQCAMDFDLWMRFVRSGARFRHVPVALSAFRRYEQQKNQRLRVISDREDFRIVCEHLGRVPSKSERTAKHFFWRGMRVLMKAFSLKYLSFVSVANEGTF
jgi:glycosyltransferase involved in cell wall biosynthesis